MYIALHASGTYAHRQGCMSEPKMTYRNTRVVKFGLAKQNESNVRNGIGQTERQHFIRHLNGGDCGFMFIRS